MRSNQLFHTKAIRQHILTFSSHLTVYGLVLLLLFGSHVQVSYGWWFEGKNQEATVTPTHRSGLVLSPLAQRIIPEFILVPLSQVEEEEPPSTTAPEANGQSGPILSPATPTPEPSRAPAPTAGAASPIDGITQEMLTAVNKERASRGLPTLTINTQLSRAAQAYADLMQELNFFSHTSPDGTKFQTRNEAAGYTNWRWMGENIAVGQTSVGEVMEDWMNSEGHRKNILSPEPTEFGVGYSGGSRPYWVQEFGDQF